MSDEFEKYLSEIFEKSFISIIFFSLKRFLMILLSYLVILFAGANVYGIISVFIRLQEVFRRLSYGVKSSLSWSIPRYEKENHIGILLSLFSFLIIIWFLVFIFLFYFRGKIITNTIINDSILVVVFSIGLIPYIILLNTEYIFLALRNVRLGMFFSKFVVPVSIILGSLASFFIIKSKESFWIWSSSIGFLTLSSILSVYLLFYTTNYNLSFENFNIKIIKKVLSYCIKTTGMGLLSMGQIHGTYLLMALYLSPTTAGLFSLSLILGKLSRRFLSSINTIFPPIISTLYKNDKKNTINQLYKSTSKIAIVGCCILSMPLIIYHKEILVLFSPKYSADAFSMIFIVIAQIIATFVGSVGLMLLMTSNEKESLYLQLFQTIITLPVMIYLTIKYGILGLSISFFFSLSFNNLSQLALLYYLEKLNPITKYHLLTLLSSTIIVLISYYTKNMLGVFYSIIVFSILLSIFSISAYKHFFNAKEKQSFKNAISKFKST